MQSSPVGVGVIGCGNISAVYLRNLPRFEWLKLAACADLDMAKAESRAAEFGVPKACTPEDLLADPEVQLVVNLTVPGAHYSVAAAALDAGKHVYNEKPLALTAAQGRDLIERAAAAGLRLGCAPDTFLGAGLQTCRSLIDSGAIGRPVAATAFMVCRGHESWHPAPEFYYKPGGGPLFDMGPYYLTALVSLLGPVRRATGATAISFPERTITSEPLRGRVIRVEVPTHVTGLLEFASGAVATLIMSFDVWAAHLPCLEIYGAEGALAAPDPNGFGGPVRYFRPDRGDWQEVALTRPYSDNWRGLGVADLADAVRAGREPRAGGRLAGHVLEIMEALHRAAETGRHIEIHSDCPRPAPLPDGIEETTLAP